VYSIGAVERLTGLTAATIRTWEARYGLVSPERSSGGQRLYSPEQVEQLQFVKSVVEAGRRPGEAHRVLAQHLDVNGRLGGRSVPAVLAELGPGVETVLQELVGADGARALVSSTRELVGGENGARPVLVLVDGTELELNALAQRLRDAGSKVVELDLAAER
jgi:DNA-binding transcriptional MerR regulator